jgi:hypothetical protein
VTEWPGKHLAVLECFHVLIYSREIGILRSRSNRCCAAPRGRGNAHRMANSLNRIGQRRKLQGLEIGNILGNGTTGEPVGHRRPGWVNLRRPLGRSIQAGDEPS